MEKKCQHCSKSLHGRSDKKFCDLNCKNAFNFGQRRQTRSEVKEIDGYLHRNREILATLTVNASNIEMDRLVLTQTGFKYEHHTSTYLNKEGRLYRIVYDYAWLDLSDQTIQIVRKKQSPSA